MESFVVRIYRRHRRDRQRLVGTVEDVDTGRTQGFATLEALGDFLASPRARSARRGRAQRARGGPRRGPER